MTELSRRFICDICKTETTTDKYLPAGWYHGPVGFLDGLSSKRPHDLEDRIRRLVGGRHFCSGKCAAAALSPLIEELSSE